MVTSCDRSCGNVHPGTSVQQLNPYVKQTLSFSQRLYGERTSSDSTRRRRCVDRAVKPRPLSPIKPARGRLDRSSLNADSESSQVVISLRNVGER
ncbi:hypothetical protein F2P81_018171 [Scophthalmus maximus]|uniref:Uncharacterized protein n=1 Tax=Scophthalmus maximus TaxID=52904 RepID=A0A6A4S1H3_SCOMX|nr:hypothetical protein F2P81_018171 [Scophthalmus maximus]